MKKFLTALFILQSLMWCFAQQDSIYIDAKLSDNRRTLLVSQEIIYHNPHDFPINKVKLQNWIAAYKNRKTPLLKRKLEDRKRDLYFAKPSQLGKLDNLSYRISTQETELTDLDDENFFIPLNKELKPNESVKIKLNYQLTLPLKTFTGYGTSNYEVALKYFFITTDTFEDEAQTPKYFLDIEQNLNSNTYWLVKLQLPKFFIAESNINKINHQEFEGVSVNDPEFIIGPQDYPFFKINIENQTVNVQLGYNITAQERQDMEFYLMLQLKFIKEKIGILPSKIFISEKFKDREKFIGIEDVKFWMFHYKLFSEAEKTDLNYFSILSKACINDAFVTNKQEDHWLKNGIKTYLEMQYLQSFYPNQKLLGNLPDNAKVFGMKPLKIFHASDIKLKERYGLAYQYILTQNLDQKILLPYEKLSNFNTTAISHFETGTLFNFISEKIGKDQFNQFLKSYILEHNGQKVLGDDFLIALNNFSQKNTDFLKPMMSEKSRINFNIRNYKKVDDDFQVKIFKKAAFSLPFKLETEQENGEKQTEWMHADKSVDFYQIKDSNADKIVVNDEYSFPETNFRDNYLYTKGLFSNMKRIKFKLIKDIPNPEYNEIFVSPRFSFNAYDGLLLGANFINKGIFDQKFVYSISPYYSTKTGSLTGSSGVSYSFMPADSFFRSWQVGASASYYHYDYNLAYRRINLFTNVNLSKDPRSAIGRSLYFSYGYFEKDLDAIRIKNKEYGKYNLWNIGYSYADNGLIHEKSINANFQWMEDFQKISTEAYYRWEYAAHKKVSFRFYGGYFMSNTTQNSLFNYGVSKVSNYAFSYGLLGQSATTGVLSQQFVLAEGGFKSRFNQSVNQWIGAVNVDGHVWKMFNVYADFGLYKNKYRDPHFIWDSGVKLRLIPDFLEIYFPVQSSLGFEPSFRDYASRIRYTLVFNLGSLVGNLRRGVY